ncbi:hypothetical protein QQF64_034597 [Cirrhinus molitorella]|uniref:Uncharacterized protein n=1 Tax=Cirrhinus molitorella TaxID=172907 RepID=A0ABR3L4F2_9TELE
MTVSLTSSDPGASALLGSTQEEQEMSEGKEAEAKPSQSSCPAYEELLEVMDRATVSENHSTQLSRLSLSFSLLMLKAAPVQHVGGAYEYASTIGSKGSLSLK